MSSSKKRRRNILWILIGAVVGTLLLVGGERAIREKIIPADPELQRILEQAETAGEEISLSEEEKAKNREVVFGNAELVISLLLLFLGTPLLVGAVVGFATRKMLEGAAASGIAGLLFIMGSGGGLAELLLALVLIVVSALLGALGAFAGARLRSLVRPA